MRRLHFNFNASTYYCYNRYSYKTYNINVHTLLTSHYSFRKYSMLTPKYFATFFRFSIEGLEVFQPRTVPFPISHSRSSFAIDIFLSWQSLVTFSKNKISSSFLDWFREKHWQILENNLKYELSETHYRLSFLYLGFSLNHA